MGQRIGPPSSGDRERLYRYAAVTDGRSQGGLTPEAKCLPEAFAAHDISPLG